MIQERHHGLEMMKVSVLVRLCLHSVSERKSIVLQEPEPVPEKEL